MSREATAEVSQNIEPIGGNRYRITKTEVREVTIRPSLAAVLLGSGTTMPVGITSSKELHALRPAVTTATNDAQARPRYESRSQLLADKASGIITGHEWWYRPEYMRLSQNELREVKRKKSRSRSAARR